MIKLDKCIKNYSKDFKIGPLNFSVTKPGLISLIGPNGAGKSTTVHMIGRLLKIDEGKISVANLDIAKTKTHEIAKKLAVLKQENHFVTRLNVRQLVGFGRFPHTKGRLNEEDEGIITKYIDFFGLTEFENRFLDELSGGQRQIAYVAMVLAQETEYILLDEPLNNLDISKSVNMMKYLKRICDETKKTIICVMHDINFAARYSDNICVMKEGKIYAFGSVKDIMQETLLTEIFETKIEIIAGPYGPLAVY